MVVPNSMTLRSVCNIQHQACITDHQKELHKDVSRKSLLQTLATVRSTTIGDGLPSPAVLLQGRNLRTNLHQIEHMLRPQNIGAEMVKKKTRSKTVDNCLLSRRRHVNVPAGTTPRRDRENKAKWEMAVGDRQTR